MNYTEAKEQAKKESGAFILWLGFAAKEEGGGNVSVDFVEYAVIEPQSGEILTRGKIAPGQNQLGNPAGVVNIPGARRHATELRQMNDGARSPLFRHAAVGWTDLSTV